MKKRKQAIKKGEFQIVIRDSNVFKPCVIVTDHNINSVSVNFPQDVMVSNITEGQLIDLVQEAKNKLKAFLLEKERMNKLESIAYKAANPRK